MSGINSLLYLEVAKVLTYSALAFILAMWWAPSLIKLLRWLKFWKKKSKTIATTGEELVITKEFYNQDEAKLRVPRGGGLLIWITTLFIALFFWMILKLEPDSKLTQFLNFISRGETFIPIGTLFFGSILGFIDDALATLDTGGNYKQGGLKLSYRIGAICFFSLLIGLWFHLKLKLNDLTIIPNLLHLNSFNLPTWLIAPATIVILLALWSSAIIDGADGMSTGVFIPIYLSFTGLAFARGYYDIATLLMVMVGAMAAFLWFNIPPAKFHIGETGLTGILLTLGVVSIFIDAIYILPISGLMLVLTVGSDVIQIFSKKVFKRKILFAAPLHHHLEALGWERSQITMRYWLVSIIASVLGLAIGLLFK